MRSLRSPHRDRQRRLLRPTEDFRPFPLPRRPPYRRDVERTLPLSRASNGDRRLRIALIAPPWYPLPPRGYGGIELVVALLARALRRQGHEVTLFGATGSAPGTTICAPPGLDVYLGHAAALEHERTYVGRVLDVLSSGPHMDVVHDNAGIPSITGLTSLGVAPLLHTVHGPLSTREQAGYARAGGDIGLIAISHNQRACAPQLPWVGTVYNAVDDEELIVADPDRGDPYLLCLARICPAKGQHVAIEVAKRCGLRLILAGKVDNSETGRVYFRDRVGPWIDGNRVVYLPNVFGREKAELLARATALLAPIQWPEPFGLAMVEAMASGTPTVAFRRGAAPELIQQGVSGFVVDDLDGMVDAVHDTAGLEPAACARVARQRFSPSRMASGYVSIYREAGQRQRCVSPKMLVAS